MKPALPTLLLLSLAYTAGRSPQSPTGSLRSLAAAGEAASYTTPWADSSRLGDTVFHSSGRVITTVAVQTDSHWVPQPEIRNSAPKRAEVSTSFKVFLLPGMVRRKRGAQCADRGRPSTSSCRFPQWTAPQTRGFSGTEDAAHAPGRGAGWRHSGRPRSSRRRITWPERVTFSATR